MTSLSSSTPYRPSTLAYTNLHRMLDTHFSAPVSSNSSFFTLPTSTVLTTTFATTNYSPSILPPVFFTLHSATFSAPQSSSVPTFARRCCCLPQFSAVRKLLQDLQQRKPVMPSNHNCLQVKLAHPRNALSTQLHKNKK